MNKKCGVYIIISPSNGRYIGSSASITKRWNRYKNLSCNNQYALIASLKKYGVENHTFSILYNCERHELLFWERVFGDLYLSLADFNNGLNIRLPGYDDVPQALTDKMRQVIRDGCKKRWDKQEEREKTSIKSKQIMQDASMRERLKISALRQWDDEAKKNKSIERKKYYEDNPEQKTVAAIRFKKMFSDRPELKIKSKETFSKYYANNPVTNSRKVVNLETGEVFNTIKLGATTIGITAKMLSDRLKGRVPNNTLFKYL